GSSPTGSSRCRRARQARAWAQVRATSTGRPTVPMRRSGDGAGTPGDLEHARGAGLVGVVGDWTAVEPAPDDVRELAGVAEVHGVRGAVDRDDGHVRGRERTDLAHAPRRWHERVLRADHGER